MNQAHMDLMLRHFLCEQEGRFDDALAEMTDDAVYILPGWYEEPIATRQGIWDIQEELFKGLEGLSVEVVLMYANDEFGFSETIVRGKHVRELLGIPPTGRNVTTSAGTVFRFENGKIKSETVYTNRGEFVREAGWIEKLVPPGTEDALAK